jgi:hypothetical protein
MPNFSGNWKIIRSENFEEMLKALGKEVFVSWEGRTRRALGSLEQRPNKRKGAESGNVPGSLHPRKGACRIPWVLGHQAQDS